MFTTYSGSKHSFSLDVKDLTVLPALLWTESIPLEGNQDLSSLQHGLEPPNKTVSTRNLSLKSQKCWMRVVINWFHQKNLAALEKCLEISGIQPSFFPVTLTPIKDNWGDCLTFPWIDLCIRRYRTSDTVSPMVMSFHSSLTNLLQNGCCVRDIWSEDGTHWLASLKNAGKAQKKAQFLWCHSKSVT